MVVTPPLRFVSEDRTAREHRLVEGKDLRPFIFGDQKLKVNYAISLKSNKFNTGEFTLAGINACNPFKDDGLYELTFELTGMTVHITEVFMKAVSIGKKVVAVSAPAVEGESYIYDLKGADLKAGLYETMGLGWCLDIQDPDYGEETIVFGVGCVDIDENKDYLAFVDDYWHGDLTEKGG